MTMLCRHAAEVARAHGVPFELKLVPDFDSRRSWRAPTRSTPS